MSGSIVARGRGGILISQIEGSIVWFHSNVHEPMLIYLLFHIRSTRSEYRESQQEIAMHQYQDTTIDDAGYLITHPIRFE